MNIKTALLGTAALLLSVNSAWAQDTEDDDEAEATIRLMGVAEAELPDAVTKEISLPKARSEDSAAVEKAAKGLEKASENRERREQGLSRADEARQQGAERAEEARENRGRSEDRPKPPKRPNP